jgi:hypothetical protein
VLLHAKEKSKKETYLTLYTKINLSVINLKNNRQKNIRKHCSRTEGECDHKVDKIERNY